MIKCPGAQAVRDVFVWSACDLGSILNLSGGAQRFGEKEIWRAVRKWECSACDSQFGRRICVPICMYMVCGCRHGVHKHTHALALLLQLKWKRFLLSPSTPFLSPPSCAHPRHAGLQVNFNVKDAKVTRALQSAHSVEWMRVLACACTVQCVCAMWLVGGRPIHLSGVIVALCNWA